MYRLPLLNVYLEFISEATLLNISTLDKTLGTNLARDYKRFVWWNMTELQKPMMASLFENGRVWRRIMDKHLVL